MTEYEHFEVPSDGGRMPFVICFFQIHVCFESALSGGIPFEMKFNLFLALCRNKRAGIFCRRAWP
jgi:hypothetical protein